MDSPASAQIVSAPSPAFIFDLDDTLLDTSGQLVLPAHQAAALAMVEAGLRPESSCVPEGWRAHVLACRQSLARETVPELLDLRVVQTLMPTAAPTEMQRIARAGHDAYFCRPIPPLVLESEFVMLLPWLQSQGPLFLVTTGHPPTQQAKVARLGIRPLFRACLWVPLTPPAAGLELAGASTGAAACPPSQPWDAKLEAFQTLVNTHQLVPKRCLVIGDRPDSELEAGRRLGMWTVRLRRGEHAHRRAPVRPFDRELIHPAQLRSAIQSILVELEAGRGPGGQAV